MREPPVPAQAAGGYAERPVLPALHRQFGCAWVHAAPAAGTEVLVVPDGRIDLLWIDGEPAVAGPDRAPQPTALPAGRAVVGLRFRAATAATWLRLPAEALVDRRVGLAEVSGALARRLRDAVGDRHEPWPVASALQLALAGAVPDEAADAAAMRHAFRLVRQGAPSGQSLVPWLGARLDMSERTLRRRFLEHFGYGPKTLDRILRFQRVLALLRRGGDGAAALAAAAGYADQAHMVREVRRLSGHTPTAITRLLAG